MSFLLAISLGPVQEFITAARRTGDLGAGSRLLTETARAAAARIEAEGGALIFPAHSSVDGSNKILARVEDEPARVAAAAREAASDFLRGAWERARSRLPGEILLAPAAEEQIAAFLEFFAAWEPAGEAYAEARARLERRLAGRKALREFSPARGVAGRPKSPLDPARECVLRCDGEGRVPEVARRGPLWLKPRETLDALSLLKRLWRDEEAEGPLPPADAGAPAAETPSTSLMALRAVLPAMRAAAPEAVAELEAIARRSQGRLDLGDCFFPDRLEEEELLAAGLDPGGVRECRRRALQAVGRAEAPAYLALLVADGDRMGALIAAQETEEDHRALSARLAKFAQTARAIVGAHDGAALYAGGDDVLAMLPVNRALACAGALAGAFSEALAAHGTATLSAGIAIVHHMEPLQLSLERARAAERAAKGPRDALAVALHTRGGAPLTVTRKWSEGAVEEWGRSVALFGADGARGLPYELLALAREWKAAPLDPARSAARLRAEFERVIRRKREAAHRPELPSWVTTAGDLEQLATQWVIARFLAEQEVARA